MLCHYTRTMKPDQEQDWIKSLNAMLMQMHAILHIHSDNRNICLLVLSFSSVHLHHHIGYNKGIKTNFLILRELIVLANKAITRRLTQCLKDICHSISLSQPHSHTSGTVQSDIQRYLYSSVTSWLEMIIHHRRESYYWQHLWNSLSYCKHHISVIKIVKMILHYSINSGYFLAMPF